MGIQISGLVPNAAFDWKSVVDQLVAAESIPVTKLQAEKVVNEDEITAIGTVRTALQALQDSIQSIRADRTFYERAVISSDAASTWKSSSAAGAPLGSYTFEVQMMATAAKLSGGANIGQRLNATSADLSGLTMNSLPMASTVKPGTFTVNGQQISFAATDSLKTVLDQVTTATGGSVSWAYDEAGDTISLSSGSGNIVLGAANDTSDFLQVFKLANNGSNTVASGGALGTATRTATLANARLNAPITAVDAEGKGSFSINGVAIEYNVNSDSLTSVLNRISDSSAGVTASFDPVNDRVVLTNKSTGDIGLSISETAGGLLGALNLSSVASVPPTVISGTNAKFRVNDGDWVSSTSNTLGTAAHGVTGLSITVNSTGTQTLTVQSDTESMQGAILDYMDKFNSVQDLIEETTKVEVVAGKVTHGILYGNKEVEEWGRKLRNVAFATIQGVVGDITKLDDLGMDFGGTTSHLRISNQGKFNAALSERPDEVQKYFSENGVGLVPEMYDVLTKMMTEGTAQQDSIRKSSLKIDEQITTLQARVEQQREMLTNAFIRMLEAQSVAQSQNQALTNAFFRDDKN